ncbi:MAG: hypothetical protein L0H35_06700 [Psychrobacter sp.]|nr:hypothetical protein [Psychrobacter sp.]
MKFNVLILTVLLSIGLVSHAGKSRHVRPLLGAKNQQMIDKIAMPGYCEIEIINRSQNPIHVRGAYLDGGILEPFDIYPYDSAHYISVYYYGCQSGMYLTISDFLGYTVYSGYTPTYDTIFISPAFGNNKPTVQIKAK